MNQGRLWTVVSPNIGLPLIIGGAAVTSLIVHYAVLTHTDWMSKYWTGGMKKAAMATEPAPVGMAQPAGFNVSMTPTTNADGQTAFTFTVTPNAIPAGVTVGDATVKPPNLPAQ